MAGQAFGGPRAKLRRQLELQGKKKEEIDAYLDSVLGPDPDKEVPREAVSPRSYWKNKKGKRESV